MIRDLFSPTLLTFNPNSPLGKLFYGSSFNGFFVHQPFFQNVANTSTKGINIVPGSSFRVAGYSGLAWNSTRGVYPTTISLPITVLYWIYISPSWTFTTNSTYTRSLNGNVGSNQYPIYTLNAAGTTSPTVSVTAKIAGIRNQGVYVNYPCVFCLATNCNSTGTASQSYCFQESGKVLTANNLDTAAPGTTFTNVAPDSTNGPAAGINILAVAFLPNYLTFDQLSTLALNPLSVMQRPATSMLYVASGPPPPPPPTNSSIQRIGNLAFPETAFSIIN